jgi:DNA-binding GntR family transcriptional regulator
MPEKEELSLLKITRNIPLLKVESKVRDKAGIIIEYSISKFRGDMASLQINF